MSDFHAAIMEARASSTLDQFELETVEIVHPAFIDDEENPDAIRLVLDEQEWDLELEAEAPLHGGQTVPFWPAAMRIERAGQEEGSLGAVRLGFDFVSRQVAPWLDAAIGMRADGHLILRSWIATRDSATGLYSASGPPLEVLAGFVIRDIEITRLSVEVTARFRDLENVGFPRRWFRQDEFPGLF